MNNLLKYALMIAMLLTVFGCNNHSNPKPARPAPIREMAKYPEKPTVIEDAYSIEKEQRRHYGPA